VLDDVVVTEDVDVADDDVVVGTGPAVVVVAGGAVVRGADVAGLVMTAWTVRGALAGRTRT
jgi:hypothetical protein